ncbi:MAG TPA: FecR domain-containing protein [Caulobacteraceae bacterium]
MTPSVDPSAERKDRLLEEASRWFARTRSSTFTPADRLDLEAWLDVSPDHREAYAEILDLWERTAGFRNEPELLEMREAALRRYPARSAGRRPRWTLVACLGGAAAAALVTLAFVDREPAPQTFRTGIGQTATIALIDGSRITLDTDTVVRTQMRAHRREIHLDHGRAFFKVAKDPRRPFVVEVSDRSVTATGTAFEVTAEASRFEVVLVEGHVRVAQPAAGKGATGGKTLTTDLEPGTRLTSLDGHGWTLTRTSGGELAWMNGELLFDNQSLADIASQMNRYSHRKIVIADPALADRKIYGAFMAGDVDQFTHALVDYKVARVQSENDGEVVLGSP